MESSWLSFSSFYTKSYRDVNTKLSTMNGELKEDGFLPLKVRRRLGIHRLRWLSDGGFAFALGLLFRGRPGLLHGHLFWPLGPEFVTFLKRYFLFIRGLSPSNTEGIKTSGGLSYLPLVPG